MPGLDKTGPEGKGSRTGRGMGKCNSENDSGVRPFGRGAGRGRKLTGRGGRGQGRYSES